MNYFAVASRITQEHAYKVRKLMASGLCVECGKPTEGTLCESCLEVEHQKILEDM